MASKGKGKGKGSMDDVDRLHADIFGRAGTVAKSRASKIKDLETKKILDRLEEGDNYTRLFRDQRIISDYYNKAYALFTETTVPPTVEQYMENYSKKYKPIFERHISRAKVQAFLNMVHRKDYGRMSRMEGVHIAIPPHDYYRVGRYIYYIQSVLNDDNEYFIPTVSDLSEPGLNRGILNKKEAQLIDELMSYFGYRLRNKNTIEQIHRYEINPVRRSGTGKCSFYTQESELPEPQRGLTNIIHIMEQYCRGLEEQREQMPIPSDKVQVTIANLPAVITEPSFKAIMNMIRKQAFPHNASYLIMQTYDESGVGYAASIQFDIQSQSGMDYGGVTRMILYKISQYLRETLYTDGGQYYLCHKDHRPLSPSFVQDIALYLSLVIQTRTQIDLPLGYGIRYVLCGGFRIRYRIDLFQLMALYWRENPKELKVLLNMVGMSDSDIKDILPDYPQSSQVPQGAEIDANHKYAWLYMVLFKRLFHPYNDDRKLIFRFAKNIPDVGLNISDIKSLIVTPLTQEVMDGIDISGNRAKVTLLRRFIKENPQLWEKLLVFITGTVSTDNININNMYRGYPVAHTCSSTLDLRDYDSYEEFQRELTYSLENAEGLHLV